MRRASLAICGPPASVATDNSDRWVQLGVSAGAIVGPLL